MVAAPVRYFCLVPQSTGAQIRKVLLTEAPLRFGARRLRLGQGYRDAGLVAREDLPAAEVAAIGNGLESLGL
jgi:hypothetical protein